jgi:DNA invertase Pin-like site-specific DNA recombinase
VSGGSHYFPPLYRALDLDRMSIDLVAIAKGFDKTNPYGRCMAHVANDFAELERSMIQESPWAAMRVKRGRRERISAMRRTDGVSDKMAC